MYPNQLYLNTNMAAAVQLWSMCVKHATSRGVWGIKFRFSMHPQIYTVLCLCDTTRQEHTSYSCIIIKKMYFNFCSEGVTMNKQKITS